MTAFWQQLSLVLRPSIKVKLAFGVLATLVLSSLDAGALALIVPVVNLASGQPVTYGANLIRSVVGPLNSHGTETALVALLVCLFVAKNLLSLAFAWWSTGLVVMERAHTSARIMGLVLSRSFENTSRRSTPELVRNMTEMVGQVFNGSVNGLLSLTNACLQLLVVATALILIAPVPTLALLLYFGVAGGAYAAIVRRRARVWGETMATASQDAWKWALTGIGAMREVYLRRAESYFVSKYLDSSLRGAYAQRGMGLLAAAPRYYLEMIFIMAVGLLISISDSQQQTVGLVALFVTAGFRSLPAMSSLLSAGSSIRSSGTALNIVAAELRIPENESPPVVAQALDFSAVVLVRDLCYRYPDEDLDTLREISFDIVPGTAVGIVGQSGAGKSTLVDVLLGLRTPISGTVEMGGLNVHTNCSAWQSGLAYVPQDIYLMNGTISENVAFEFADNIDVQRLTDAIAAAQLTEVVKELSSGWNTEVGERGSSMSGGQRQRLGIARALYRQPQLLVLDEATSALDNETERAFVDTMAALRGRITTIVIAHRLSTVTHCDIVHFMSAGRIVDSGSFAELESRNKEFASMVRLGRIK